MTTEEITKKAEDLARKYNPEGQTPFPFAKLQQDYKDLGIFLVEHDGLPEQVSGAISYEKSENAYKVLVNRERPWVRQHFTTAHEVGHYFLHQDLIKQNDVLIDEENYWGGQAMLYRSDSKAGHQVETQADIFAASLLMPEELVRKVWAQLQNIQECAKIFQVSNAAMSIRLERLGLVT